MTSRSIAMPVLLVVVLFLPAAAAAEGPAAVALPRDAVVAEKIFGLPELPNLGRVAPTFYRGAQPEEGGLALLRTMGIRTVINLRLKHSEREEVEAAGMRSVEIPMNAFRSVDDDLVRRVLSLLADDRNHPVFLHCRHGKDRTGMIVALYRMEQQGWSKEAAVAEMEDYGFNGILYQLKNYVRDFELPETAP